MTSVNLRETFRSRGVILLIRLRYRRFGLMMIFVRLRSRRASWRNSIRVIALLLFLFRLKRLLIIWICVRLKARRLRWTPFRGYGILLVIDLILMSGYAVHLRLPLMRNGLRVCLASCRLILLDRLVAGRWWGPGVGLLIKNHDRNRNGSRLLSVFNSSLLRSMIGWWCLMYPRRICLFRFVVFLVLLVKLVLVSMDICTRVFMLLAMSFGMMLNVMRFNSGLRRVRSLMIRFFGMY